MLTVKPDPPVSLDAVDISSREATLRWEVSKVFRDQVFMVTYQSKRTGNKTVWLLATVKFAIIPA